MSHEPEIRPRADAWSGGDSRTAQTVARPLIRFLAQSTASGVILILATVAALVWANSPWSDTYTSFWHTEVDVRVGSWRPFVAHGHSLTLHDWVNDAAMALFFFVVGLQITSELVVGDLRDRKVAMLPAMAAVGGMAVPALVYVAVNAVGDGVTGGWGVPMATDIAFAVGVLALLGDRVPPSLRVFVLMLAIVDDIGAILVIALFYTDTVSLPWLAIAFTGLVAIGTLRRMRAWYTPLYLVVGVTVWYATLRSGVHATIAGVAIGMLTPVRPLLGHRRLEAVEDLLSGDRADPTELRDLTWRIRESMSVASRLIALLSPWTVFIIVPVFALANAGIPLSAEVLSDAASSPVSLGVAAGLVFGKPAGVVAATWLAKTTGIARLPGGITMRHITGTGFVAGIGFTVALFIAGLAFTEGPTADAAVIGVLAASVLAAVIGAVILAGAPRNPEAEIRGAPSVGTPDAGVVDT